MSSHSFEQYDKDTPKDSMKVLSGVLKNANHIK